jgi:cytochrome c553
MPLPDADIQTSHMAAFLAFSVRILRGACIAALGSLSVMPVAGLHAAPERVDELVRDALQRDSNVRRGATLYAQHCASCHGPQALGDATRLVPSLAGQRRAYVVKQLADFTELERDSRDMHNVVSQAKVGQPQVWADIAAYVNGLPVARFTENGDGAGIELGEAIFREQCASCHEEDARGDDDGFVPSLRNQHYAYLLRQMRSLAAGHRVNVETDLVLFLDNLETDELTSLADYLSRLRGPTRDRLRMRDDGSVSD